MQAKNTALSSELVRCTIALLNRSEWEGAGNAVTPQQEPIKFDGLLSAVKVRVKIERGQKIPPPPQSPHQRKITSTKN